MDSNTTFARNSQNLMDANNNGFTADHSILLSPYFYSSSFDVTADVPPESSTTMQYIIIGFP